MRVADRTLFFLQEDGSFTLVVRPFRRNWTVVPSNEELFRYTFNGREPSGSYTWLSALTEVGTLNLFGGILQAPFIFSP